MNRADRLFPLMIGGVFVVLLVIFVARLLGALVTLPVTVQESQCEVTVDIVCPVQ